MQTVETFLPYSYNYYCLINGSLENISIHVQGTLEIHVKFFYLTYVLKEDGQGWEYAFLCCSNGLKYCIYEHIYLYYIYFRKNHVSTVCCILSHVSLLFFFYFFHFLQIQQNDHRRAQSSKSLRIKIIRFSHPQKRSFFHGIAFYSLSNFT